MKSVISYPDRGPYGNNRYRGNCSGYVIKDLIEHFRPALFVDVCEGSGTSRDVAREMGVRYIGLDLHKGFDFTQHSVLNAIGGEPAPMVFSHPPYYDIIRYQDERKKHGLTINPNENDLSSSVSIDEFLEKCNVMLLNQREATMSGGVYTSLIGDVRKGGKFHSFQSDFIKMMPKDELLSVVIKMQHNMVSAGRSYRGNIIEIWHEYLLIWKKQEVTLAQITWDKAKELQNGMHATWRSFIRIALMNLGGTATLDKIYEEVARVAGEKVKSNIHYREKIRQTLQKHFCSVSRGKWAVAA